jgi:hypothetical protein
MKLYRIYENGLLIGTLPLSLAMVKKYEKMGYRLRIVKKNATRRTKNHRFAKKTGPRCKNPKGLTLIYKSITRVEGTKGTNSSFPGGRFYHNFKRPYPSMYGSTDRKTLVIK